MESSLKQVFLARLLPTVGILHPELAYPAVLDGLGASKASQC